MYRLALSPSLLILSSLLSSRLSSKKSLASDSWYCWFLTKRNGRVGCARGRDACVAAMHIITFERVVYTHSVVQGYQVPWLVNMVSFPQCFISWQTSMKGLTQKVHSVIIACRSTWTVAAMVKHYWTSLMFPLIRLCAPSERYLLGDLEEQTNSQVSIAYLIYEDKNCGTFEEA